MTEGSGYGPGGETPYELDDAELEDDGVLDASDTLEGEPGDDPLDQSIVAADRWSAGEGYGNTLAEERSGESLDQQLAQEQADVDPYAADPGGGDEDEPAQEGPGDPRAGRLVAEDEGAHADEESDLVARDVGIDGGAASAEEAAVHVAEGEGEGGTR